MKTTYLIFQIIFLSLMPVRGWAQRKERLTLESVVEEGRSDHMPSEICWAPDGHRIGFYLADEHGDKNLWIMDIAANERTLAISSRELRQMAPSADEAAIGERERTRRTRYDVPSFLWAPDGQSLLFTSSGRLYRYSLIERKPALLAPSKTEVLDPKFSPDGQWISFIHQHDLWVIPSLGGKEKRLTYGGSKLLLHGEPDWIYQEEFDVNTGYHWSPDSRHIAFIELDEREVPVYPLIEQNDGQPSVYLQSYPKAGDPNPKARVGIVGLKKGKILWADKTAEYVPRLQWADSNALAVQLLNRAQNELELVEVDVASGRCKRILAENDPHWLNIGDDLTFISGGREFLWTSDRTGFRHIYLYSRAGKLVRPVTSGDWVVFDIEGVDTTGGWIYYSSNQSSVLGRDLFRIKMDGSGAERVTGPPGTHRIQMNAAATAMVDSYSSMARTPEVSALDLGIGKKMSIFSADGLGKFDLCEPEIQALKTPDGATVRVLLLKPRKLADGERHPLVVYVYGMPGSPTIQNAWAASRELFHQFLVQQGYIVAQIDDRSSAIPGHKYEVAARGNIGPLAARDHQFALEHLKSLPFVDSKATAIWGWSGGGFITAYHMTRTNLFKAGIAVAPATDWRLYDSIYTERYMGLPGKEAGAAYDRTSALKAAAGLNGRLLLVHGTLDDNVHPENTYRLVRELIGNGKQFELMMYPDKTHGISGRAESVHLYTLIYEFLERNLRGLAGDPKN
jgi:dipeptidyl-peptidase-4